MDDIIITMVEQQKKITDLVNNESNNITSQNKLIMALLIINTLILIFK